MGRAAGRAVEFATRSLSALWVVDEQEEHAHGDEDMAGAGSGDSVLDRQGKALRVSRVAYGVVLLLLLLGLREVLVLSTTEHARDVKIRRRDPFQVLEDFAPKQKVASALAGQGRYWRSELGTNERYLDEEQGDITAVVLHWKRTENVVVIVAQLCQYSFFNSVFIWNNNPEIQLSREVRGSSSALSELIANAFLADVQGRQMSSLETPHLQRESLAFENELAKLTPLRSLPTTCCSSPATSPAPPPQHQIASSRTTTGSSNLSALSTPNSAEIRKVPSSSTRIPKSRPSSARSGASSVRPHSHLLHVTKLKLLPAEHNLHTCFAWVGTGAFVARIHVQRFLATASVAGYGLDELSHADNSFSLFQNEPPYVLSSRLSPLPQPYGHSDGAGIARNKEFIVRSSRSSFSTDS